MKHYFYPLFALFCLLGCAQPNPISHIAVSQTNNTYVLTKDGEEYQVKGAGLNTIDENKIRDLKLAGGNTFRTWSTQNAKTHLTLAQKYDLMVLMGIDLKKELHGFDYNDEIAVEAQFESVKNQILAFKDHPNLLGWIVANEPNLLFDENGQLIDVNPKVYDAISQITAFIHENDGNHPVTYSFAGVNESHIKTALARTPNIDFISVQVYGELNDVNDAIVKLDIDKPFMVTEFGPTGHWEVPTTEWGREIEEPSGVKANRLAQRLDSTFLTNPTNKNIGHFVFYWGQKQERTPTWYGIYNKDGNANARLDEMARFWQGNYPVNRAPSVSRITLDGVSPESSLRVTPNQRVNIRVEFVDPNNDEVSFRWAVLKEVKERSQGGAFELEPEELAVTIQKQRRKISSAGSSVSAEMIAPDAKGEYRLFFYCFDNNGKVGNANFPFYVE